MELLSRMCLAKSNTIVIANANFARLRLPTLCRQRGAGAQAQKNPRVAGWEDGMELQNQTALKPVALRLEADFTDYRRDIARIFSLLKSRDARERIDGRLLDRLDEAMTGLGGDELFELVSAPAADTGHLTIKVQIGGVLKDLAAALRALGFEFQDEPVSPIRIIPEFNNSEAKLRADLTSLTQQWEQSARSQFQCAERTADPMGKRLVQHGGTCYFNCASAVRQALDAETPPPLPTQAER